MKKIRSVPIFQLIVAMVISAPNHAWASDSQIGISVATWINFVVLLAGLAYLLRKPIRSFLSQRHDQFERAMKEAEELRSKVEKMVSEYEKKLSMLDKEISEILAQAKTEGEKERQAILQRAAKSAAKIIEDARFRIDRERDRLKRDLEREIVSEAVERAVDLLRKRVGEVEHRAFASQLIKHLETNRGSRN